jgi:FkbM family methyltransferase
MVLLPIIKRKLDKYLVRRLLSRGGLVRKEVMGHDMVLDVATHGWMLYHGIPYEPQTTQYITNFVEEGKTVIDVGASNGYYTLLLARLVGPRGLVYAFEPLPRAFRVLRKNISINGYENVILENKAASEANGMARFYVSSRSYGRSSLCAQFEPMDIIEVETARLDSYSLKNVDLVKIDVEGAEVSVLRGMRQMRKENPNLKLIVEFAPQHVGFDAEELFEELEGWHYKVLDVNLLFWRED